MASVTVAPPTPLVVVGTTVQLTATVKDAGGNTLVGRAVTWGTSNGAVATVSSSGLVTAVAVGGPVTIMATSEGVNGTATVSVTPVPVTLVTVSPGTPSVAVGTTVQLTATTKDASGNTLVGRTVTWGTSNGAIATVSSSGLVTAVAVGGPVTITATSEGINGTANVTVIAAVAQTIYWTMFSPDPAIPQIQAAGLPLAPVSPLTNVPFSATMRETAGMTFDASGRLWVISFPTDDHPVAAVFLPPITAASVPALIFPLPGSHDIDFLSFDHAGNLWASDWTNQREYMFTGPFATARTLVPTVTVTLPGFTPTGNAVDAA
ncbi:MAG: Ig-like domain-containing protein, partial [Gemmatimonadales bacterium]